VRPIIIPVETNKNRRVSLTKAQRQTEIGIELISLCQSFTEDGSLSDNEIHDLRAWLESNHSADLPAIGFLVETIQRVLEDGKVTKEERRAVYKALESVLPSDIRKETTARRRNIEREELNQQRVLREQEKQKKREERERNKPLGSWNFMVAGVRYENRPSLISKYVQADDTVYFKRDKGNKYSRNALEVRTQEGVMVGYVPEDDAADIAPLLDQDCRYEAFFTKILSGGRFPIPVVQAYIYRANATIEEAILQIETPASVSVSIPNVSTSRDDSFPWEYIIIGVIVFIIILNVTL
jgi:hypothetical protein